MLTRSTSIDTLAFFAFTMLWLSMLRNRVLRPQKVLLARCISRITAAEFLKSIKSADPETYQIVDVREANELKLARLKDVEFTKLPLSEFDKWSNHITDMLDPSKRIYCLVMYYRLQREIPHCV